MLNRRRKQAVPEQEAEHVTGLTHEELVSFRTSRAFSRDEKRYDETSALVDQTAHRFNNLFDILFTQPDQARAQFHDLCGRNDADLIIKLVGKGSKALPASLRQLADDDAATTAEWLYTYKTVGLRALRHQAKAKKKLMKWQPMTLKSARRLRIAKNFWSVAKNEYKARMIERAHRRVKDVELSAAD